MGAPQKAFPIAMSKAIPETEGSRAYPVKFDFTATTAVALNLNLADTGLTAVKTMFIDNSNGPAPAYFTIPGIGEIIVCPAYSQGFFPFLSPGLNLQANGVSTGAVIIPCLFLNVEIAYAVWSMQGSAGTTIVSGAVTANPALGAFTNRSGSIAAAGVSQNLAAANGVRKRLIIFNPVTAAGQNIAAAESLFINFTNAAGVNDGASIELTPGGSFDTATGPCTSELVTVTAATIAHRYIAKEM